MNPLKFIWGTLFRLFPCPTKVGLRRIGRPDRQSPVLVTCNFYVTVRRLLRKLRGFDIWLLVADSKGVNVWCSAGGDEFNTHSVVTAVKTSGIAERVDKHELVLSPLAAPGVEINEIKRQSGWSVCWGPVRIKDIPLYLEAGRHRIEEMKRITYNWQERLDTALGSLFPFFLLGAIGFVLIGPHLLLNYLVVGSVTFFFFMLACPWLPGSRGLVKVLFLEVILAGFLIGTIFVDVSSDFSIRADIIIAMVTLLIYGSELGGLAPNMPSDLDPFLSRLGIGAIGNVAFAGTVRTELLNGFRVLNYDHDKCIGCRCCVEICPQGCWELGVDHRAVFVSKENCTACRACLVQCETGAIKAELKLKSEDN
jgi:NAD-dependent dihydropyrimidine dehydrogenase PreA subunit